MEPFHDLCCEGCGSQAIGHFQTADGEWRNRCRECGDETEYVPNQAEIAAACEVIRAQRPWQLFNDDEERLLRLAEAVWEAGGESEEEVDRETDEDRTERSERWPAVEHRRAG